MQAQLNEIKEAIGNGGRGQIVTLGMGMAVAELLATMRRTRCNLEQIENDMAEQPEDPNLEYRDIPDEDKPALLRATRKVLGILKIMEEQM